MGPFDLSIGMWYRGTIPLTQPLFPPHQVHDLAYRQGEAVPAGTAKEGSYWIGGKRGRI